MSSLFTTKANEVYYVNVVNGSTSGYKNKGNNTFTSNAKPADYTESSYTTSGQTRYKKHHAYSYNYGSSQTATVNITKPITITMGYKDTVTNTGYQYYVTTSGCTEGSNWYNPGNHTFYATTKPGDYTESSWSGQTGESVGNIRYHVRHTYSYPNGSSKAVNLTGATIVTLGYKDTTSQIDKQQYQQWNDTQTPVAFAGDLTVTSFWTSGQELYQIKRDRHLPLNGGFQLVSDSWWDDHTRGFMEVRNDGIYFKYEGYSASRTIYYRFSDITFRMADGSTKTVPFGDLVRCWAPWDKDYSDDPNQYEWYNYEQSSMVGAEYAETKIRSLSDYSVTTTVKGWKGI